MPVKYYHFYTNHDTKDKRDWELLSLLLATKIYNLQCPETECFAQDHITYGMI